MTFNFETEILELENPQSNPIPVIESLAAREQEAAPQLISQLEQSQAHRSTSRLAWLAEVFSKARQVELVKNRRIVIALGAMKAKMAMPVLLRLIASPCNATLGRAVSWSMANIGEDAVQPIFSFSRNPALLVSAKSLAITTLGYIRDPRVPTILRDLWRQYRLQVPDLVVAALTGLILHGQVQEAYQLAQQTEDEWHFQGSFDEYFDHYWENLTLSYSIEYLKASLKRVKPVKKIPDWPVMIKSLEAA